MAWTEPKDWVPGEIPTATDFDTHIKDNFNAVLPLGAFLLICAPYTTVETAVEGRWLQCNGVAVSRTTYATLFNMLNAFSPALPFGAGDGTTTFNLPDLRGRVPVAEGEHADVVDVGKNDGKVIAQRSVKHFHNQQFGSNSLGGTVPIVGAFDTAITRTYPTSPGPASIPQDAPAYQVVGSWFIKYRS